MPEKKKTTTRLKAHILQAMVESALTGHNIGPWQSISADNQHFQAVCRQCRQAALVSTAAAITIPSRCPK